MKTKALLAITLTLFVGAAGAAEKKIERKGVLAGLPSVPGAHMAKIKALGEGQWVNLGRPAPDPRWGQGRGRSWSHKMAYLPDAQGAIICGAGRHAYINPQGYYDDIFFYDLNAHKWICIFPGVNTKTFGEDCKNSKYTVNDDGQLVDKSGQAIPLGARSHSGQTHTYDTDSRKWVYNGIAPGGVDPDWWSAKKPWFLAGKKHLKAVSDKKVRLQPIYFNTVTGRFERPAGGKPSRGGGARGEVTYYLPTRKAIWTYGSNTMMIGDPRTGQWKVYKKPKGAPPGSDFGACYDSKRHRIYLSSGIYRKPPGPKEGFVNIYDVATNNWMNYPNKENAIPLPSSNVGMFHYDSVSDRVVIFWTHKTRKTVSEYDPETREWTKPKPLPAGMVRGCSHGFYSPEVNAHFIYFAGDSSDKGTMWAYRHKRKKK